jgi:hypothetical protein
VAVAIWTALLLAAPAHAGHSLTELYNPFYVVGVTLVVVLSFVVVVLVVQHASRLGSWPTVRVSDGRSDRRAGLARLAMAMVRAAAVLGLLLVILTGLFGHHIASWNPAPKLVWVVAWIVIPAVQVLVGNVWAVANPWLVLFEWAERIVGPMRPRARYRTAVGVWPALGLFVVLVWFRVSSGADSEPRVIGLLVLVYSVVTWAGMAMFGKHVWLCRAECLTVFYSLLAAIAPTEARVIDGAGCRACPLGCAAPPVAGDDWLAAGGCVGCPECSARSAHRSLNVRPWAVGLLGRPAGGVDTMLFVLVMLATGMFGGLLETRAWEKVGVTLGLRLGGAEPSQVAAAAAFVTVVVVTVAVYWLACLAIRATAGSSRSTTELALAFAITMIPLAAGFHLTHGVDHTFEDAQRLLRLLSDPLGLGWNVLGTRMRPVVPASPPFVWYVQLIVIVAAHVAGVYVAHVRALSLYRDRRTAIYSQFPMVAAIILFTVSGLWILTRIPMVL